MEVVPQRELKVKRTLAIDLDNVVLNTPMYHQEYLGVAEFVAGVEREEMERRRELVEREQRSFHTDLALLEVLEQMDADRPRDSRYRSPQALLLSIQATMISDCHEPEVRDKLYMPGAHDFIERLIMHGDFRDGRAFFLTHGVQASQMTKLSALGLSNFPYIITQDLAKGELISGWREANGKYRVSTMQNIDIVADELALVDDKTVSMLGLPSSEDGVTGFLKGLNRAQSLGDVAPNVERVKSFDPVLRYLGHTSLQLY